MRLRRAAITPIAEANAFLTEVVEKVASLDEMNRTHPLSVAVAQQTVERFLSEERHTIKLHDLVMHEVENVFAGMATVHAADARRMSRRTC